MKINRPSLNLIVDVVAFVFAVFLVMTGFILEYTLPPGSGRLEAQGQGGGPGSLHRTILLLWGLTRHEWGDIHLWMAIALLAALSLHLVLHWQWIACMVEGRPRRGSGVRVALGILGLVSLLALALAPFLSSPERLSRGQVLQQRQQSTSPK